VNTDPMSFFSDVSKYRSECTDHFMMMHDDHDDGVDISNKMN
jgi:hypothetical protein